MSRLNRPRCCNSNSSSFLFLGFRWSIPRVDGWEVATLCLHRNLYRRPAGKNSCPLQLHLEILDSPCWVLYWTAFFQSTDRMWCRGREWREGISSRKNHEWGFVQWPHTFRQMACNLFRNFSQNTEKTPVSTCQFFPFLVDKLFLDVIVHNAIASVRPRCIF